MTVNRKVTGTAATIPAGLSIGILTAMTSLVVFTWITAILIDRELLPWDQSGYGVMIILILSSWIGAATASGRVKRRKTLICMVNGGIFYIVLLIITALFFGGKYSGVVESGLLVFCGSVLGIFSKSSGNIKRNGRKYRRHHG